jgi:serine phosphatase RsbU (regulator of sigma subunit)
MCKPFILILLLWVLASGICPDITLAQSNITSDSQELALLIQRAETATNPNQGIEYAKKAENLAKKVEDAFAQARIYTIYGNIYGLQQHRTDRAAEYHRKAFDTYLLLYNQKKIDGKRLYSFFKDHVTPIYELISSESYNKRRRDKVAIRKYQELYTELSHFYLKNETNLSIQTSANTTLKKSDEKTLSRESLSKDEPKETALVDLTEKALAKEIAQFKILNEDQKKLYEAYIAELEDELRKKGVDIVKIKEKFSQENQRIRLRLSALNIILIRKDSLIQSDSIIANQKIQLIQADKEANEFKHKLEGIANQRNIAIFAGIGLLLAITTIIFYRNAHIFKKQNRRIEDQNNELAARNAEVRAQKDEIEETSVRLNKSYQKITDSLIYAQTMQAAVLPRASIMYHIFPEHFVIFKPKDIVSGDFYWLHQSSKEAFLVVADCTGHGVPGGFMSMIGYMLLNKIIKEEKTEDLSLLLTRLDQEIQASLQQNISHNTDGIDLSICKIELQPTYPKRVQFAGAKQTLFYTTKPHSTVQEIKGDRWFVGGDTVVDEYFKVHELFLERGGALYLPTDGFIDQSNEKGRKFSRVRLTNLLTEIQDYPMPRQADILQEELKNHQENSLQRDDITLVGIRV